jgi:hypothetical protein
MLMVPLKGLKSYNVTTGCAELCLVWMAKSQPRKHSGLSYFQHEGALEQIRLGAVHTYQQASYFFLLPYFFAPDGRRLPIHYRAVEVSN